MIWPDCKRKFNCYPVKVKAERLVKLVTQVMLVASEKLHLEEHHHLVLIYLLLLHSVLWAEGEVLEVLDPWVLAWKLELQITWAGAKIHWSQVIKVQMNLMEFFSELVAAKDSEQKG